MEVHLRILRDFTDMKQDVVQKQKVFVEIQNAILSERSSSNSINILQLLEHEAHLIRDSICDKNIDLLKKLYILDTAHLLEEYRQILRRPIVNSFSKQRHQEDRTEAKRVRHENYRKFVKAAREYAMFEIPAVQEERETLCDDKHSTLSVSAVNEGEGPACRLCGQTNNFSFDDEFGATRTCLSCLLAEKITTLTTSCSDVERVSISGSRCVTDRRLAFRDCINQYQGKQTYEIPQTVYNDIKNECVKLGFVHIGAPNPFHCVTKDHIAMILRDFGHTRQIENINLIYHVITGHKLDSITHLETSLLRDYEVFMAAYNAKVQQGLMKKRCIAVPDVIYKILRKLGHPCLRTDFVNLRGGGSQNNDDVTEELFRDLGWTHPT